MRDEVQDQKALAITDEMGMDTEGAAADPALGPIPLTLDKSHHI